MKKLLALLSLLVVFVLAGCSSKKTYEYEISTLEKVTVTSSLAFHSESNENYKLIFADDGYIYYINYKENGRIFYEKLSNWEKRGDIIVVIYTNSEGEQYASGVYYYQLYENGKYLMEFHYPSVYFYVAE